MNRDITQGALDELLGNIKQKWGRFTGNNALKMQGFYQAYYGTLQKKNGYIKNRAQKRIQRLLKEKKRNSLLGGKPKKYGKDQALRIVFSKQEPCILQKSG